MAQSHGVVRGNRRGGNSGHREKRDANTAVNRELKQENQSLKKQVARLKKSLSQTEANSLEIQEVLAENVDIDVQKALPKCEVCGARDLVSFTTPSGKVISGCKKCAKK